MKKTFYIFSINLLILIFLLFLAEFSSWIILSVYKSGFFSNKSSVSLNSSNKSSSLKKQKLFSNPEVKKNLEKYKKIIKFIITKTIWYINTNHTNPPTLISIRME